MNLMLMVKQGKLGLNVDLRDLVGERKRSTEREAKREVERDVLIDASFTSALTMVLLFKCGLSQRSARRKGS